MISTMASASVVCMRTLRAKTRESSFCVALKAVKLRITRSYSSPDPLGPAPDTAIPFALPR